MIKAVFEHKYTAVQSGHSMSKDYTAGIIALIWLIKYYPSAKVIATAPKLLQVKEIMFGEISKQFARLCENSPWPLDPDMLTSLKLEFGPECYALGFTTKESSGNIGKFMGFKSPNILIMVSEAQAVDDLIFDEFLGITTSTNSRVLELGNPIAPMGRFWQHCTRPQHGYHVIKLSCLESPNVIAGEELVPGMVTKQWVEERRIEWGEDHPYWFGRVLGEFPQSGADCIIPIDWIMRAIGRHDPKHVNYNPEFELNEADLKVAGLDISKGGTDETAYVILKGRSVVSIQGFHKVDIHETVAWAKGLIVKEKIEVIAVDEGGLAGVAGFIEVDDTIAVAVMRIMFGASTEDDDDFANVSAAMWWALRTAFQNNEISIIDDPILIGQLSGRRYEYTQRGQRKIKMESKASGKSRGVESPDRADALCMAWWARTRHFGENLIYNRTERDSQKAEKEINKVLKQGKREDLALTATSLRKKYVRESADLP